LASDDSVRLPIEGSLDLHAFRPQDIKDVVSDYVEAAHEAGLTEIRLIHGRGIGVQRAVVHAVLASHPLVDSYWDAPESHLGATVLRIKTQPFPPSRDASADPP
jgi:DNA-nicking Smr family endonuclease